MEQLKALYEKMEQEFKELKTQHRDEDYLNGYKAALWDLKVILEDDFYVPSLHEIV